MNIPDGSNFYSSLNTDLSREEVAKLYAAEGWLVRKCSWIDFEVRCSWAELVIEGENPVLLHGPVASILTNAERIFIPLQKMGISYSAECYGEDNELLRKYKWSSNPSA